MDESYFTNSDNESDVDFEEENYTGGKKINKIEKKKPEGDEELDSDNEDDVDDDEDDDDDDGDVREDDDEIEDNPLKGGSLDNPEDDNEYEVDDKDGEGEGEDDDDDDDDEFGESGNGNGNGNGNEDENEKESGSKKRKNIKQIPLNVLYNNEEEEDDNDEDGEVYLKKFNKDVQTNYIMNFHPECILHNYDEIEVLTNVVRDKDGIIIDDLHRTIPYLTKYERTRILGQRAKQIDAGATAFVKVPENVIEGYLIALLELEQKRIPFIIRRPLPNGGSEYWNVKDLENISF